MTMFRNTLFHLHRQIACTSTCP